MSRMKAWCPICDKAFQTRGGMVAHYKMVHMEILVIIVETYLDEISEEYEAPKREVTPTGRLAQGKPNTQNIPVRTPEGKKIRDAFLERLK